MRDVASRHDAADTPAVIVGRDVTRHPVREMMSPDRPWGMTPSGVLVPMGRPTIPTQTAPRRPAFDHMETYLCASEIFGNPAPARAIIDYVRKLHRIPAFAMLAALAATLANVSPKSKRARALTTGALAAARHHVDPRVQRAGDFCASHPERVIAHERVIYWLQALVLVECEEGDRAPGMADLAWLMLLANDHIDAASARAPGEPIDKLDAALASFARESRFNVGGDPLAAVMRGYDITRTLPEKGPLADASAWEALERRAFYGMRFHDYFIEVLAPLVAESVRWGLTDAGTTGASMPVIDRANWYAQTRSRPQYADDVFDRLSVSLRDAINASRADIGSDGLPQSPSVFAQRPFLQLEDGRLIAASPWLVRQQIRLGLWGACRGAAVALHGDKVWNPAFGESFELWARGVALRASTAKGFAGNVVLSAKIGDPDELEDVVIIDGSRVALISAKSRLLPDDLMRDATERARVVDWYESVLLAESKAEHRAGALRLLDKRVQRIRAGKATGVAATVRIYPVLLTYERLGDNPVLHTWVRERCAQAGVLGQADVAPVTFVSAAEYEWLLAGAAQGASVFDVLEHRVSTDDGLISFESALARFFDGSRPLRVPGTQEAFDALMTESVQRLFG